MNKKWTRKEDILALFAYYQIPFNKTSNCNHLTVKINSSLRKYSKATRYLPTSQSKVP